MGEVELWLLDNELLPILNRRYRLHNDGGRDCKLIVYEIERQRSSMLDG